MAKRKVHHSTFDDSSKVKKHVAVDPHQSSNRLPSSEGDLVSDGVSSDGTHTDSSSSLNDPSQNELSDVEVSFECFNMAHGDFHAIKHFLNSSFAQGILPEKSLKSLPIDTHLLTQAVVDICGEYVGTTAKSSESEDPLAFITLLPLNLPDEVSIDAHTVQPMLDTLNSILKESVRSSATLSKGDQNKIISSLEDAKNTALVFHERYLNLPAEMAAPLYQQLIDDLPAAKEESAAFDPANLLIMCPIYHELEDVSANASTDVPTKKNGKPSAANKVAYQYYYGECELLENEASAWWNFRIDSPHTSSDSRCTFSDRGIEVARRMFLMPMVSFRRFVRQIQSLIQQ